MSLSVLNEDKEGLSDDYRADARPRLGPGAGLHRRRAGARQRGAARPLHGARHQAAQRGPRVRPRDDRGGADRGRPAEGARRRRGHRRVRRRAAQVAPRGHGPGRLRGRHADDPHRRRRVLRPGRSPASRAARTRSRSGTARSCWRATRTSSSSSARAPRARSSTELVLRSQHRRVDDSGCSRQPVGLCAVFRTGTWSGSSHAGATQCGTPSSMRHDQPARSNSRW